ncbi:hypothetical protein J7I44_05135 [Frateuria sp. MAH-13]|uniref:Uncharacterized protein n=1 Tax=Frateuria flava TaxID=2821489 RepID=A0ABS4DKU0_9GAMM|nr:hypothetical protein [Frateuria flava]MBP1473673.1 hypothetical protein [Frateuria flava]
MNKSLAANLALAFMVLSTVALIAAMSATAWEHGPGPQPMHDPRIQALWATGSQLFLVSGAALAGYAYAGSKTRSIVALLLGVTQATWYLWIAF